MTLIGLPHDRQIDCPVPPETFRRWSDDVAALAPRSDALSWLHLAWEPGDPWEPIERFVVWQMRPLSLVRWDVRMELDGPPPRSTGHLCVPGGCLCALKANHWAGGAAVQIDQRQWELYRQTGCYGTRWWIVQGATGGHLRRFTTTQRRVAQMHGLPADPPAPGDLPYAPVDGRVLAQIAARDRMRAYGLLTDFLHRSPEQLDAEERAGAEDARRQLVAWIKRQVAEVLDEGGALLQRGLAELPYEAGLKDTTDYEAEEQALLRID